MDKIGIVKEIDSLGRLQIPRDIRKRMGLEGNVELVMTKDGLLVKSTKYHLVEMKKSRNKGCILSCNPFSFIRNLQDTFRSS